LRDHGGGQVDDEPTRVPHLEPHQFDVGWQSVDMVRCQRFLEIIEEDGLVTHAATAGAHLLDGLRTLQQERPE